MQPAYETAAAVTRCYKQLATCNNPKEMRNIYERYLIAIHNGVPANEALIKAHEEMTNKKIKTPQKFLKRMADTKVVALSTAKYTRVNGTVLFPEFIMKISAERMKQLIEKTSEKLTVCMMLRYHKLLIGSQQWSLPQPFYDAMKSTYGTTLEGFASPINAKTDRFCSLFPMEDEPFGSIGNFFNTELAGESVVANPPFTPFVMGMTAKKIEKTVEPIDAKVFIVSVWPTWKDFDAYKSMEALSQCVVQLAPKTHYFVDEFGTKIKANFPSTVFVVVRNLDFDAIKFEETVRSAFTRD